MRDLNILGQYSHDAGITKDFSMYCILQQEETHKQLRKHHYTEPTAFFSNKRSNQERDVTNATDLHSSKGHSRQNKFQHNGNTYTLFCDHCKNSSHTINKCFKLLGYPNQNKGRKATAIACTNEEETIPPGMSINNAFLHGDLVEEVYMKLPKGLDGSSTKVCKLKKSIYGLKQASREWFTRLVNELVHQGFQQSQNECSLFIN